jgi:hypothetical protein
MAKPFRAYAACFHFSALLHSALAKPGMNTCNSCNNSRHSFLDLQAFDKPRLTQKQNTVQHTTDSTSPALSCNNNQAAGLYDDIQYVHAAQLTPTDT